MSRATLAICAVLLLTSGCSRALRFGYSFESSDGGSASHDLAKPKDQAMALDDLQGADLSADLPMMLSDGGSDMVNQLDLSTDLAATPDLRVVKDLQPTSDLLADLKVLSQLGGPCADHTDCIGGLTCFKDVIVGSQNKRTFPNGYCTVACSSSVDTCSVFKGSCVNLGTTEICVRICGEYCPTNRNLMFSNTDYGCCSFQAAPPDGPIVELGCLPTNFTDVAGYSCL